MGEETKQERDITLLYKVAEGGFVRLFFQRTGVSVIMLHILLTMRWRHRCDPV